MKCVVRKTPSIDVLFIDTIDVVDNRMRESNYCAKKNGADPDKDPRNKEDLHTDAVLVPFFGSDNLCLFF